MGFLFEILTAYVIGCHQWAFFQCLYRLQDLYSQGLGRFLRLSLAFKQRERCATVDSAPSKLEPYHRTRPGSHLFVAIFGT